MSALDVLKSLNGFDANALGSLQRILLVTDGTLTEILEAAFLERIELIKISQQAISAAASHAQLFSNPKENLLERKILLRGARSGRNYAYAESLIAFERLDPAFRDELLNSNTSLGRLWLEHKLETFKELQAISCRPANDLSHYFECANTSSLLVRTYHVVSAARPVMSITEYFPAEL